MINLKLIVFFFSVDLVTSTSKYCEICPNHTFCKYTMPGPSASCKEYEENPLTKDDVNNIVSKINEGRNFVATGLSKLLPQAANMNKIYWSDELAAFAQRWVNQCDGSIRPDREDECRDLEDTPVGQNIVTVIGPSPGMHLTSLVDVWLMHKRAYHGSVAYYNQSRDWKSNQFTQLIWAQTDKMGCGRARFYVDQKQSMVERLVCNFAPKGNIQGKPVYAIGYPATQCQDNKVPDDRYKGLCAHWTVDNVKTPTTAAPAVSSLLRILNLSNNSIKLEIDPIRNNLKQYNSNVNGTLNQRNQRIRNVFSNNSHTGLRNMPPPAPPMPGQWNRLGNSYTANPRGPRLHQRNEAERGHSRLYHGHEIHDNNFATNKNHPSENFRKFDYSPDQTSTQATGDFRKYGRDNKCSRMSWSHETKCESGRQANHCTRKQPVAGYIAPLPAIPYTTPCAIINASPLCKCNTPRVTCATMPPNCRCGYNCQCFNSHSNNQCLSVRKSQNGDNLGLPVQPENKKEDTRKSAELNCYDLLPNMAVRSGDGEEEKLPSVDINTSSPKDIWLQHDTASPDLFKRLSHKIHHEQKQVKDVFKIKERFKQEHDYIYDSPDSRERKRRSPADEIPFKPFWQMDEYNRDKSTQLKSLRFTTLSNRKPKKSRRITTTIKVSQTTESITVKLKDAPVFKPNQKTLITEKYLSFDELMHLRKLSSLETTTESDARRRAANDDKTSTTVEYTANTPFVRMKHCTRKLTCTWTAPTVTAEDGRVLDSGMGANRGSRTPPGYVEGCTRTSTCTRDFMNRNKFSTISDYDNSTDTTEDEDYCEKRALNVRRRDSNSVNEHESDSQAYSYSQVTLTMNNIDSYITDETDYSSSTMPTTSTLDKCLCHDEPPRNKRHDDDDDNIGYKAMRSKRSDENVTYGDLFYIVLQKIITKWQSTPHSNQCLCNSTMIFRGSISVFLFIFFYNVLNQFI